MKKILKYPKKKNWYNSKNIETWKINTIDKNIINSVLTREIYKLLTLIIHYTTNTIFKRTENKLYRIYILNHQSILIYIEMNVISSHVCIKKILNSS